MKDQSKTKQTLTQKKASLNEAGEYADSIINTVREPLIVLDHDLRVVTASRSFYEFFKVNPKETMGQLIYDLGNKQWDIPKLRELLETILPQKTTFDNYEVEHDFATIGKRIMLLNARQIKRALGKERIILLAIEDITERRQLENILKESEERYRRLFETERDGIVFLEQREGKITHANPAIEKMLGYTEKEIIGNKLQDIGITLDMGDFQTTIQNLDKSGIINYRNVKVETKSGQHIDTEIYLVDRAKLVQCNIHDVTERKQTQEALKENEKKYRVLYDFLPIPVYEMDFEANITSVNRAIYETFGGTEDDLKNGFKAWQLLSPEEIEKSKKNIQSLLKGKQIAGTEYTMMRLDGSVFPAIVISSVIYSDGKPVGLRSAIIDITDRKKSEEKLLESDERYRSLFERSLDLIYTIDFNGRFIDANDAALNLFGYKREEIRSLNVASLIDEDQLPLVLKTIQEIMETGTQKDLIEFRLRHKDGSDIYVDSQGSTVISNGKPIAIQAVARDVTDRKRADEALRKSENQLSNAVNIAHLGPWEYDVENDMFTFNDHFYDIFHTTAEQVGGYTMSSAEYAKRFVHPDDAALVGEQVRKCIETDDPNFSSQLEHRIIYRNGEIGYITVRIFIAKDEKGRTVRTYGVNQDITERRRAEDELKESENKYRLLADNIDDVIFVLDMNLNLTYVSPSVKVLMGYEPEEFLKLQASEAMTPSSWDLAMKKLSKEIEKSEHGEINKLQVFQSEMRRKDRSTVWTELKASFIKDKNQRPVGIIGVSRDITERKQAEDDLKVSEINLRMILDSVDNAIFIYTKNGKIIDVNNEMLKMYRVSREEVCSMSIEEDFSTQENPLKELPGIWASVMKGEEKLFEWQARRPHDGSTFYVEVFLRKISLNNVDFVLAAVRDISERKRADEELQQTLESLRKSIGVTIQTMVSTVEMRDPYTAGHQLRTANLASAIATEMGFPQDKIEGIRMAGSIHDIGKLSIPAEILSKPTKLTDLEFSLIKEHPRSGYEILKNVESPWPLAQIAYQHHERMNGSGYPRNLKGDEILMEARIMAVADVVEAMASNRPYRPGLGIDAALAEIEKNKGTHYDNTVADACLRLFREKGYQLT
jgi:PAS domain S-box-containing protein